MTQELAPARDYFEELVEHLTSFSAARRKAMAEMYGVPSSEARDIARAWYRDPAAFLAAVDAHLRSSSVRDVLHELAVEHDHPVPVEPFRKWILVKLEQLGLARVFSDENEEEQWVVVPALVAMLLSERLKVPRPSLPLLLGQRKDAELLELMKAYEVEPGTSRLDNIVRLCTRLEDPGAIRHILGQLPDPEWMGAAMMVLELGGLCYWQEIFGYDLNENLGADRKVVPLMRSEDVVQERALAERLMELAILHRLEDESSPHPMLAVAEEMWFGLWMLGRGWLVEWTSSSYFNLTEQGVRRPGTVETQDLQATLKWLLVEADREQLRAQLEVVEAPNIFESEDGEEVEPAPMVEWFAPNPKTLGHLVEVGGRAESYWKACLDLAFDLHVMRPGARGVVREATEWQVLLDMPRPGFVREVLLEWCTGYAGRRADRMLPQAMGLDEGWRQYMLDVLMDSETQFIPAWMTHVGVASGTTGSGWLRNLEDGTDEVFLEELRFTSGCISSLKLVWLDMLSLLEWDRWYPVGAITELLQVTACLAMFGQLGHLNEGPQPSLYLPIQRSSYYMDAYHTEQFTQWTRDLLEDLLGPLGLAVMAEDGEWVWLDTRHLRVESPDGLPDDARQDLVREVLGDEALEFRMPSANRPGLRTVAQGPVERDGFVNLDAPTAELREYLAKRPVTQFDGRQVRVGK